VNARNTNTTTYFLRELRALEVIRDQVASPAAAAGRRARIWSVGCSSGDEPYGLALLCLERGVAVDIVATDVNPVVLERARRGRYHARNLRHVSAERRQRWFRPSGNELEASDELRQRVDFARHDITVEGAPCHDVDVVICRNVIVYFDAAQLRRAVATMLRALRPGGMLVLGASEWLRADLRHAGGAPVTAVDLGRVIVYQRAATDTATATATVAFSTPAALLTPATPIAPPSTSPSGTPPSAPVAPVAPVDAVELDVAGLRAAGDALLDRGCTIEAAARYDEAIARAPLVADLHLRAACCHLQRDAAADARSALRRALFLRPSLWPAWLLLADLSDDDAQRVHCRSRARLLLESPEAAALDADPTLRPFTADRRVALDALRHPR
jgi:chemotaxis protein methyltransferase CheR